MPELLEQLNESLSGRYALEREIGRGGMAVVYLARDQKHDRQVAVKVVHPELTPALGHERFLREIGIASKLTHPHILPLYDSGEAGGHLYYVMPYIEGESLRERLSREGPLSVDAARQMAREVGSALSYAHDHGIVHRDIKPENIMLSGGHAVVTDFGVAKALTDAGGDQLTKTGFATGTPQYMSPEQAAGEEKLDARSDEYALACVVYETLAGEPPFTGPTSQAVIARHTMDPVPSLRTVRSAVPVALEAAVERALEKMPADRFDSVEQFVEAVTAEGPTAVSELAVDSRPRTTPRWLPWAVAAIAVAAVAILAARQFDLGGLLAPAPEEERVAIIDFQGVGLGPELEYLTVAIPEFLSLALTGETGGAQAIDRRQVTRAWERAKGVSTDPVVRYAAVAEDLGATHVITGQVIPQPNGQVLAQAELKRGRETVLQSRPVVLPASEAIAVAESLGVQLLAASAGEFERLPGLVSSSTESVQEWLAGTQAFRKGDWAEAIEHFAAALDQDSTFALAAWGLMMADAWYSEDGASSPVYQRGRRLAWAHQDRLPPSDSSVFVAESHRNNYPEVLPGGEYEMFEYFERAVQAYPDSWNAWIRYGDYLYHEGGAYVDDGRSKAIDALTRAVELDTLGSAEPYQHLVEYYVAEGDQDAFAQLPESFRSSTFGQVSTAALGMIDPAAEVDSATWALIGEHSWAPIYLLFWLQPAGTGMDHAERLALLLEAHAAEGDGSAAFIAGTFALNRGQPARADRLLRIAFEQQDGCIRGSCQEPEMWIQQAMFADGDADVAQRVADSLAVAYADLDPADFASDERAIWAPATAGIRRLTWVALWNLSRGDTTGIRETIQLIRRAGELASGEVPAVNFASYNSGILEASLAVYSRAGDARQAVVLADSAYATGVSRRHQAPYLLVLADLFNQLGDTEAALNRYRREWFDMGEESSLMLSARRLGRARMAAELGLRDEAIRAYEQYLALRSDPEPILEERVAAVRAEYGALVE